MALSSIALCGRALLKLGARTIASFDEGTVEAEVAANLYPVVRDGLLSGHPWNFATAQATLPRLAAEPVADFNNAFQLPADFLRALSTGGIGAGRGLTYRIHERRLHANAEAVTLTYIFRPDESTFPPFFDETLIARLSAEFCLPLTESTSRGDLDFASICDSSPGGADLVGGVSAGRENNANSLAIAGKASETIGGAPWATSLGLAPGAGNYIFGFDDAPDLANDRARRPDPKLTPTFDGSVRLQQIAVNEDPDGITLKDGPTERRRKQLLRSLSKDRPGNVRLDLIGMAAAPAGGRQGSDRNSLGVPFGLSPLGGTVGPFGRNWEEDVWKVQRGLKRIGFFPAKTIAPDQCSPGESGRSQSKICC